MKSKEAEQEEELGNGQWRLEVTNREHNHKPSLHASAHPVYHRRTAEQTDTVRSMTRAGSRPTQILTALQQENPDTLVTAKDIRTDRKKIKMEHMNGRSSIETLLDDLSSSEWIYDVKRDSDNRIQYLFFAHQKQVEMQLANPDVLMMDCTYRTNKYKVPLLHVLGCTNLQTFFSAGFCFLRNETRQDYQWAVSAFLFKTRTPQPRVFISDHEDALKSAASRLLPRVPQLLCVWHINKNVQTKAQLEWRNADAKTKEEKQAMSDKRSEFMGRWVQIVYSKTEAEFESKWEALRTDYESQPTLCEYLQQNQYPFRHEWARPWTSRHRHYNTTTTSPIEGMHKVLKDYLMTSRGDFLRVVERIGHLALNQYSKYRTELASSKTRLKFEHNLEKMPFLLPDIHDVVTPPAIEHVRKQEELRQQHLKEHRLRPCTGYFEMTYGLPCYHTLQAMKDTGSSLWMSHFDDDHWRYQRRDGHSITVPPRPNQYILEPLSIQSRGPPRRNEASTRRGPSAFERRVPATATQPQSGALAQVMQHIETTTHTSISTAGIPVTTVSVSISTPAMAGSSPPHASPTHGIQLFSPMDSSSPESRPCSPTHASTTPPDGAPASQQPAWQPPSLEDFEADIRRRRFDPMLQRCQHPVELADFLRDSRQEDDPHELVLAREMALDTTGIFADCTPRMAWNCHFGDREAFHAERHRRTRARNPFEAHSTSTEHLKRAAPEEEAQDAPNRPSKRVAAEKASNAWTALLGRKGQRRT